MRTACYQTPTFLQRAQALFRRPRPLSPWGILFAALLLSSGPTSASDVMEPWDRGASSVEMYASFGHGTRLSDLSSVIGFGLPAGVSVGATFSRNPAGPSRGGIIGMYSRHLAPGADLDVFFEAGMERDRESAHGGENDILAGLEWSLTRGGAVYYIRPIWYEAESHSDFHLLTGLMIPAGGRVELHFELAGEMRAKEPWPRRFSFGPNVQVSESLEVLPEVGIIHDPVDGAMEWEVVFGLVIDPRK